jgi:uncharacterized protein (TIGR00661 family)
MTNKRVLVAPLDWGLGHATRCIPIIEELMRRNCEVVIASSGSALALLKKEFPALVFFSLPSYRIKYPRRGSFVFSMVKQIPKIRKAIVKEHKRLQKLIIVNKIDLVISDNRYGCYSEKIPSIIISHQLNIQLPVAWRWAKYFIDSRHDSMIRKFNQCWLPDDPELKLSGQLSNRKGIPVRHVGILSRFKPVIQEDKYDIAVILSGPEPQRSVLEKIISQQVPQNLRTIIVRGVIEGEGNWKQDGDRTVVNFLQSHRLEEIISQSKMIIARSGYSTVMDLARMGKKAIFIPTPGQTEQEYLAKEMMQKKITLCVRQDELDLLKALELSSDYTGFKASSENKLLKNVLDDFLKL